MHSSTRDELLPFLLGGLLVLGLGFGAVYVGVQLEERAESEVVTEDED